MPSLVDLLAARIRARDESGTPPTSTPAEAAAALLEFLVQTQSVKRWAVELVAARAEVFTTPPGPTGERTTGARIRMTVGVLAPTAATAATEAVKVVAALADSPENWSIVGQPAELP